MKDRALQEQLGGGTLPVRREQRVEVAKRLQILASLSLDHGPRLRQPGGHDDDEFHEELVLEPRPWNWRINPPRQRCAARLGELVHPLAATVARDAVAGNQTIALEPRKCRVDLPCVQRRQQLSEFLLQRLPQFVPVAALTGEEGEEVLTHR